MNLKEIELELQQIAEQMKPLVARVETLNRERSRLKSLSFIEANGIRKDDVEMSSGSGKPFFGVVYEFGKWLKKNSNKRFCEWNGRIYFTAEIANGLMAPDAPGIAKDLG